MISEIRDTFLARGVLKCLLTSYHDKYAMTQTAVIGKLCLESERGQKAIETAHELSKRVIRIQSIFDIDHYQKVKGYHNIETNQP